MVRCQVCGHDNPETNRFCGECAAPLGPAERSDVRKIVTIVFCDVVGSTAMGEALDPESVRRVMGRYFDAMHAAVQHHGGTVEKFIGDAVMAVFGVPKVHEDDALRAVRAAAEMRATLAALNTELDRDHGMTLACRIGVNTGEVVAGGGDQTIVTGDAVNVAARLEQGAAPSEILLGEATLAHVRDAIAAEPVDVSNMKGKADRVPAFRLREVTPGAAGFARHLDAPMVGRKRELSLLRSAFDRTVTDQACQLLTILGVAGVGKSRLIAAFIEGLGARATVLHGRCLPYGEGITFYPLTEALIDVANLTDGDSPRSARGKLATLMGDDENAERIAERVGQAIGIPGSETSPEETLWAIRVLLERLASQRPLVFVIDDLQWAEPTFLELVEHIADLAQDAPILLACMARPELLDDHPGWAGGKLNATSMLLERLGAAECGTLVGNLFADDAVDEQLVVRIADAAEGNPLFAEEMTGLMVDEGHLVRKDDRWVAVSDLSDVPVPPTISALLATRLDRLPSLERRLIGIASVIGQVFYTDALRELVSEDHEAADVGIAALVRKQFVRPERSDLPATEALAFRHLLIRDAAYDAIAKATRAELHEGFADWLEQTAALGERDEILGYHLEQAVHHRSELGPLDEHGRVVGRRAADLLASAGRRAFDRNDLPASVNLLDRAAALLPPNAPERADLLVDLGGALQEAGELVRADAVLGEADAASKASGDARLSAHAALARMYLQLFTDPRVKLDELREEIESAIPVFEDRDDHRGLARAWRLLSWVHNYALRQGSRQEALERALDHARQAGDRREEILCLYRLASPPMYGPMPVPEAERFLGRLAEQAGGDRTVEAGIVFARAFLTAMRGHFEEARDLARRCVAMLEELGMSVEAASAEAETFGFLEVLAGDLEAAEREVRRGYEILERVGETGHRSTQAAVLGIILGGLSRYAEAEAFTVLSEEAAAGEDALSQILWRQARAAIEAHRGHVDRAEALAVEAVALAEPTDAMNIKGDTLMDLAGILRLAGREEESIPVVEQALALYEQKGNVVSADRARAVLEGTTTANP